MLDYDRIAVILSQNDRRIWLSAGKRLSSGGVPALWLAGRYEPALTMPMADRISLIADLVTANRILAHEGVVDGFGHVSLRDPNDAAAI